MPLLLLRKKAGHLGGDEGRGVFFLGVGALAFSS